MNWKFHLKFNLILAVIASIPISAAILWSRDALTFGQLFCDSLISIAISFVVGAFVPFHWVHHAFQKTLKPSRRQFRVMSTVYVCMVISACVNLYFKWVIYGATAAFWLNFWRDFPAAWLIAIVMTLWTEPYITAYLSPSTR